MIVRISGEGQYRLDDDQRARLDQLEQDVVSAVDAGDEDGFLSARDALLEFVRAGSELGDEDLEPSDVILPPADTTLVEAGREFTGEGLIPD